ncbi:hypothetical protein, partial [Nocardia sp. NPDC005998]|uniref:hypothetical protein n=1 Tax=Nocardia sp. NPDC005998 TaxID=3156894 RepID=UPI0033AA7DB0
MDEWVVPRLCQYGGIDREAGVAAIGDRGSAGYRSVELRALTGDTGDTGVVDPGLPGTRRVLPRHRVVQIVPHRVVPQRRTVP